MEVSKQNGATQKTDGRKVERWGVCEWGSEPRLTAHAADKTASFV